MRTGRCDKCGQPCCVIVMKSPIIDRQARAELGKDLYDWCLDCARLKYPNFTLAQRKPVSSTRRPWFERYEAAAQQVYEAAAAR